MADNPQVEVEIADNTAPTLATSALQSANNVLVGAVTEAAPASDTASSGLNGRLQRIAQRLTSVFTALSDGTQQAKIRGGSDGTIIGNTGTSLNVVELHNKPTYSAIINGLAVASSPTDIFLIKGSATKKVIIKRIYFTGYQNNVSYQSLLLIKRSADNTGGTRTALNLVPSDSADPAATAEVYYYTANPSALGTAVGTILALTKMIAGKNTAVSTYKELLDITDSPAKNIVLNNANEYLALNLNAETMAGSNLSITVQWTEE